MHPTKQQKRDELRLTVVACNGDQLLCAKSFDLHLAPPGGDLLYVPLSSRSSDHCRRCPGGGSRSPSLLSRFSRC
jgi:hypothetical protein